MPIAGERVWFAPLRTQRRPTMNRDELKEKIKAIIIEAREEDHHGNLLMYSDEATDSILSLIDSQRCVWTNENGYWISGCGEKHAYLLTQLDKYCRYCGKRIEVKDGQG